MFRVILCIHFYRLTQLIFSTLLKGIIRKECQSFTNHGHNKNATDGIQSAITVADPLSEYGGQPHTMASRHCQSHSCVPVVCKWFAQGSKKSKQQSRSMMFRVIR